MMRKEARLHADDRIRISVDAQGEVAEAIAEHEAYICMETLTRELRRGLRRRYRPRSLERLRKLA
jgi:hypothetical protein